MKIYRLFPIMALLGFVSQNPKLYSPENKSIAADTIFIKHTLDGMITEWPEDKFTEDKETSIRYAVDNDNQNLYMALRIADNTTQIKMMRMGMNMFIDMKGKKKENKGVEFPLKRDAGTGGFSGGGGGMQRGGSPQQNSNDGNSQPRKIDMKAIRASMAMSLIFLKVFGFTYQEEEIKSQGLNIPGNINIAFSWDSTDVMYIEYMVPLSMLADASSLNQKSISIGWKINGVAIPSSAPSTFSAGRSSGRGGFGNPQAGGGANQADMEKMTKEQLFWTKYTFTSSTGQKAF